MKFRSPFILLMLITFTACAQPTSAPIAPPAPTQTQTEPPPSAARPTLPALGSFDPATVADINLNDYPVVPEISAEMVALYRAGIAAGNNPRVFSKLGDCMTENPHFFAPFSDKQYDLGEYASLQTVIDQFIGVSTRGGEWTQDSFATVGLAAASGFNVAGPLDPIWANPKWCNAGETPIACEYRVAQPSIAILMFGTNDATYTDPDKYNFYLRSLVDQTLQHNVLPLLSTFPTRPEEPEKSRVFNQIVARIAHDYGVPLIQLNRALAALPHEGVDPNDTIHLSVPPDGQTDIFSADHLQYGFTVRNLVTLQALQAALKAMNSEQ